MACPTRTGESEEGYDLCLQICIGDDMQLYCAERGCWILEMAVDTIEIH